MDFTTDYLSLLTGTVTRISVHRMLKEFTNNFNEYESKLVHTDLLELSRTYQIGACISPFFKLYKEHNPVHPTLIKVSMVDYFDKMTFESCFNTLEHYCSTGRIKDCYELGRECVRLCNSTPFSFKFKKVDDNVKDGILKRTKEARMVFGVNIDYSLMVMDIIKNAKIDNIELPQGLKYALDIMAEKTGSGKNNNSEPATLESILPDVLKTDEAIKIFQNAIDAGLINIGTNKLEWTESKLLLSYFAYKCSEKLSLGKKEYESGIETRWRPFETVFGENNLKSAKNDYEKTGKKFYDDSPDGDGKIDRLFK